MNNIAFIPHKERLKRHRVEYLRAMNEAMDYPWQGEDGRDLSPVQQKLHDKCAELSGVKYWTFTDCCTDSLQIAIEALTNPGAGVAIPSYGWRAFKNAVLFMGRVPIYVDIDKTGNIDPELLDSAIQYDNDQEIEAVIAVHNFGTLANMPEIEKVALKHNIYVIEDAAPAFYMKEPYVFRPGNHSHVTCYSFDFTKYPGTLGSGGGLSTNYLEIDRKLKILANHGRDPKSKKIVDYGTKSYMDNLSCAVLLREIELFEEHNYREKRHEVAKWYMDNLPYPAVPGDNFIWERYTMEVPEKEVEKVLTSLNTAGVLAKTFFKEPLYAHNDGTNRFVKNTIHLPSHHFMTEDDLERIKEAIQNV